MISSSSSSFFLQLSVRQWDPMPQCSPLSGQVLLLCHRVSSPEECGLATFWLLIVCVGMSGAHVLCFEELGHRGKFLSRQLHVLAQAIVSCAQPEYYGLLATGHSMDGVTWIAVGVVALPFSSHRCFDKSFGLCI